MRLAGLALKDRSQIVSGSTLLACSICVAEIAIRAAPVAFGLGRVPRVTCLAKGARRVRAALLAMLTAIHAEVAGAVEIVTVFAAIALAFCAIIASSGAFVAIMTRRVQEEAN